MNGKMAIEQIIGQVPEDWEYTTLGAVCQSGGGEIQTGPFGSQLHASDYVPDGVPSIMPLNIGDNRIIEDGIARITPNDAKRLSRYLVRKGDIVYSRRGDVERRALVRDHEDGWLCGTGCLRVRPGENGVDSRYASFYLGHPSVREWIARHAHGATMPNLNTSILAACPFVVPPPNEQRAIAHILSTLDDKIELNRRMNETLEAMARAIFKSWFVDFDPVRAKAEGRDPGLPKHIADLFPDRFEDSELGEIPLGWKIQSLYDCAEYINGSAFRNEHFSMDGSGLPIIKIAELKDGITDQTKFTDATLDNKYRITSGDILFSWSGSPDTSIDTFVWVGTDGWLNQHIFKISFKRPEEQYFVYYLLRHLKPEFIEIARNKQTTGLGHVTAQDLKRLNTVFPSDRVLRAFNLLADPLFQRVYSNHCESRQLTALRDTLLPKLISGELRVKTTKRRFISEVA
jgi:type I restriction enzyme S subunit